uniref:Metalloendopeptidase n=1 Tax=Plectus sambesii TaxID=2011161 RepID=A0A914XQ90_9BILA
MMLTKFVALAITVVIVCESRSIAPSVGSDENEKTDTANAQDDTGLTAEDFENAKKLTPEEKYETHDKKGMENSNMFEGDIANPGLNSSTIYRFMGQINPNDKGGNMRNVIKSTDYRWRFNTIPYTIASDFTERERAIIALAMSDMMKKTCYTFVDRNGRNDHVRIIKGNGCYSAVGNIGRGQDLSLGDRCVYLDIIQHELMHAIGLFHEQSRADRDQYVEVLSQNIKEGYQGQFNKYDLNKISHLGQPYDYKSLMHYEPTAFSKSGAETVRPVASARARGIKIENSGEMSPIDIKKLNIMGGCPNFGR